MMVGGAVAGLFALVMVAFVIVLLIILAFYNKRLALFGFLALLAFLFYPIVAMHISYALHARGTPYNHIRHLEGGSYGVILPDDGTLWRADRHWSDDPSGSLSFVSHVPDTGHSVSFRIYRISQSPLAEGALEDDAFDWSNCLFAETDHGLRYIAPEACPTFPSGERRTFGAGHIFVTPPDTKHRAFFNISPFVEPNQIRSTYLDVGPYRIWASGGRMPIELWPQMLDHIASQIDAHVTLIENP